MDESRQFSSGAGAVLWKLAPPPALCGFLLLLALVFAVSYAAGPVAPGMHGTGTSRGDSNSGEGGGTDDMGAMHGGGH
ncbi:hypothetical protein ACWC2T_44080 [Streptomyces sp. NPDC001393]